MVRSKRVQRQVCFREGGSSVALLLEIKSKSIPRFIKPISRWILHSGHQYGLLYIYRMKDQLFLLTPDWIQSISTLSGRSICLASSYSPLPQGRLSGRNFPFSLVLLILGIWNSWLASFLISLLFISRLQLRSISHDSLILEVLDVSITWITFCLYPHTTIHSFLPGPGLELLSLIFSICSACISTVFTEPCGFYGNWWLWCWCIELWDKWIPLRQVELRAKSCTFSMLLFWQDSLECAIRCWENTKYRSKCLDDVKCLCSEPGYQNVSPVWGLYSIHLSTNPIYLSNEVVSDYSIYSRSFNVCTPSAIPHILVLPSTMPSHSVSGSVANSHLPCLPLPTAKPFVDERRNMLQEQNWSGLDLPPIIILLRVPTTLAFQLKVFNMQRKVAGNTLPAQVPTRPLISLLLSLHRRHSRPTSHRNGHLALFPLWTRAPTLNSSSPAHRPQDRKFGP